MTTKKTITATAISAALAGGAGTATVMRTATPLMGDGNHDGQVTFDDITATLANYLANTGQTGPAPQLLEPWVAENLVSLHPLSEDEFDQSPGQVEGPLCVAILRGRANEVGQAIGVPPLRMLGTRCISHPLAWPIFPPPGSMIEQLVDAYASESPKGWTPELIDEACRAIIRAMDLERVRRR